MADHLLSVEVAVDFGVNAALIFHNIANWCEHNRANRKHFFDGRYWTYNSISAFSEIYPYFTEKQIRNAIDKLIEGGLIVKGNYNKLAFDKTTWYALTDKGEAYRSRRANGCDSEGERICPECQTDSPEKSNGFASEGEAIPSVNTFDKRTIGKPTDIDIEAEEESLGACEEINPYGDGGYRGPGDTRRTTSSDPPQAAAHLPLNRGKAAGEGFGDTVQAYALNNLRVMTPGHMQEFDEFLTVHGVSDELMRYAIDVACGNGAPVWNYVAQVLYGWLDAGVKSVGDAKAEQEKHRKKRDGPPQRRGAIDRENNKVPLPYGGGKII